MAKGKAKGPKGPGKGPAACSEGSEHDGFGFGVWGFGVFGFWGVLGFRGLGFGGRVFEGVSCPSPRVAFWGVPRTPPAFFKPRSHSKDAKVNVLKLPHTLA